ncbi:hypothetical protein SLS62_008478 [Diatrype stigma]|uniref:Actin-like ATPase domain-containing protein n=1 Tax=Diatrype stigma TaxID=117547 RepID=A0AAN9UKF1_9PEZI
MGSTLRRSALYIGIDFGTTFSGVTWLCHEEESSEPPNPGDVQPVSRWPSNSAQNSDSFKVPSKIAFDPTSGEAFWGWAVPEELEPTAIKWFKLLLLDQDDLEDRFKNSDHIKQARKMVSKLKKDPIEVISKYLELLWAHAISRIVKELGQRRVAAMPYHVVITIPAMWKDYTRDRMSRAAKMAHILDGRLCGETTLSFISEPEAATLTVLPDIKDLKAGDSFVLCDCGGGTVDLISYTVDQMQPLTIHETVEGEATFLDEDFFRYLKQMVGPKRLSTINATHAKKTMSREWEHLIKRDFDGDLHKVYSINIVSIDEEDDISLDADTLRFIFRPTVERIDALVDNQIRAVMAKTRMPPKFIVLVGGFGRAEYLATYLREREVARAFRGRYLQPIEVHQQTGDKSDKWWDERENKWQADNQMKWIVKRGESIESQHGKAYNYYDILDTLYDASSVGTVTIYTSPNSEPGSRFVPQYRELATFNYNIPVKAWELPKSVDLDDRYRRFEVEYRIEISGSSLDLSVWYQDVKIGGRNFKVSLS